MKTALALLLAIAASSPAEAYRLNITTFPSHWLLDKGPRVIHVTPFNDYEVTEHHDQGSPSLAVPYHMKTNAEAEAEARIQSRQCLPVRVTTDDGSFLHRPSECRP